MTHTHTHTQLSQAARRFSLVMPPRPRFRPRQANESKQTRARSRRALWDWRTPQSSSAANSRTRTRTYACECVCTFGFFRVIFWGWFLSMHRSQKSWAVQVAWASCLYRGSSAWRRTGWHAGLHRCKFLPPRSHTLAGALETVALGQTTRLDASRLVMVSVCLSVGLCVWRRFLSYVCLCSAPRGRGSLYQNEANTQLLMERKVMTLCHQTWRTRFA